MYGTTSRTNRTKFSVMTSNACRQSSSVRSANRPCAGPPELLTRTSTPPNRSAVAATTLLMSAALVRSAGTASTSAPVSSLISCAAACRSASVRAQIVTRAPSRASASADALPRPLLAAPTSATLPFSPRSTCLSRLHPRPAPTYRPTLTPRWIQGPDEVDGPAEGIQTGGERVSGRGPPAGVHAGVAPGPQAGGPHVLGGGQRGGQ